MAWSTKVIKNYYNMISRGKQMMMLAQKRSQENVQNYSKVQNVNQSVTNSYDEKTQDCLKPNTSSKIITFLLSLLLYFLL